MQKILGSRYITPKRVSNISHLDRQFADCLVLLGADLRDVSSITRSVCEQIFSLPIRWAKATGFPESATHAVDFGPGGLSGIGSLTARELDGRGVRVVIVGEKGKNGAEIYDSTNVRRENWWSKKWAPQLVKTR